MTGVAPRLKLTYADYLTTPEDKRHELLDGALVAPPAPNEAHQRTQAELGYHLMAFVKAKGLGRIYYSSTDVVLSDIDVVQPDLLFVSTEQRHIITPDNIQGAPTSWLRFCPPSHLSGTEDASVRYTRNMASKRVLGSGHRRRRHHSSIAGRR